MSEYIDKDAAVGEGYLQDWYIESVVGGAEPVWTEAHIEELANDFIVIPKDTPAADVAPVVHGHWISEYIGYGVTRYRCSRCGVIIGESEIDDFGHSKYCCMCGAKMDGGGKT